MNLTALLILERKDFLNKLVEVSRKKSVEELEREQATRRGKLIVQLNLKSQLAVFEDEVKEEIKSLITDTGLQDLLGNDLAGRKWCFEFIRVILKTFDRRHDPDVKAIADSLIGDR